MASNTKIGLLLGSVLICVIAFVINGLPRSDDATKSSVPRTPTVDDTWGIGARERAFVNRPAEPIKEQKEDHRCTEDNKDAGSYTSLPVSVSIVSEPMTDEESEVPEPDPVKSSMSKVYYAVCKGDNLADIAEKSYGALEGNRKVNIIRIFEANRKLLTSPHEIYVGQKLVIPPLRVSVPDKKRTGGVFPSSMFEKVKSIGRNHLSTDKREAKQSEQYTVQEGDSLWRIAAEQLGDGNRYKEISKLNAVILEHEDRLAVGMRLSMPAR